MLEVRCVGEYDMDRDVSNPIFLMGVRYEYSEIVAKLCPRLGIRLICALRCSTGLEYLGRI